MEPTAAPHPVLRTAVLFGVITGALCIAWVLFLHLTDNNPYGPKRTLSDFFPPIAAVASQVLLRRYYAGGPGLWKSIGVGLLTTLIGAGIAAAGMYTFARLTDARLIEQHLVEARHLLENAKALYLKQPNGAQQYAATLQGLARTPAAFAQDEFMKKIIFGLLLSIPGGVFLRK
ncbi:hypothetical protein HNQ93_003766 [Hymenobacter luteus]|uniref:DUF4199 domain-containing protein n=2 Tax=Hymenobacter TaxID=89966 RepID=A0A7W9WDY7_9BACT|nr:MULTISPECIES: DUF4199 domain-containing protein [Hymenobacter]MBB4602999.1 hypothetical protein [Hymenobacter latericoloratus]MBB6060891.1 hypothetical protein [Hymenobacter luteus]